MTAAVFLNSCIDLFSAALSAVLGEPVLSFFAAVALFLCAFAVFGWLVQGCRK